MQLSFITMILSLAVAVFAQTGLEDPVKMDRRGIALEYPAPLILPMCLFFSSLGGGWILINREYYSCGEREKVSIRGIQETRNR
jgi:hypothetical protein